MGNRWWKWIVAIVLIAGGGVLFYKKVYLPKATYEYVVAKRGELNLTVFGIGNVSAKNVYPISSNSGGKIVKIFKDQGEFVKKGEVVALLDPVDLPQQLEQAKALLRKAMHESDASKEELRQLQAKYDLAKKSFRRYENLYKRGYAAQAEYDKALSDLQVLKAQIEASQARIAASLEEQRKARYNIEALQERIARLQIVSPIDGYIVSKDAQEGQTIAPQQPIITAVRPHEVWVRSYIDERISTNVSVGERAWIVLRSQPHKKLRGEVVRIEAKSDPVTEERVVDVAFQKPPFPFYLNEQAEVTIHTGTLHDVVLVPLAVIRHGGVWVYRNGEAHFVKIKIVAKGNRYAAVQGVKAGEKILVPDPHKKPLFEGADVRI